MLLMLVGCATRSPSTRPVLSDAPDAELLPVRFIAVGGAKQSRVELNIASDGSFTLATINQLSTDLRDGSLPAAYLGPFARVFAGWSSLKSSYPTTQPSSDSAYRYAITYAGHTVTASDASPDVPDRFWKARDALIQIAPLP
jgi:hypothetical protein